MSRVLVTRRLPGTALDRLAEEHELDLWEEADPAPRGVLLERIGKAKGLLAMLTDTVDDELLGAAPYLVAVANYAVGVDNIDVAACAARGVAVGNTPDVLTDATADLTLALLLAAARRLPEGIAAARDGSWRWWRPDWLLGLELRGATLGIVGNGRIGSAVGERAAAFGMRVIHSSRSSGVPLAELLAASDVVSLHCPLTPQTRHLINAETLALCKPGSIIVNTARGPIVDQVALADALRSGRLGAAALDVTDPEPLPLDDPLLLAPNLIVLPHLGSATHHARARMADLAVDNLLAALAGNPMPHPVSA